jgi:pilus assembly protein Flp/PilA
MVEMAKRSTFLMNTGRAAERFVVDEDGATAIEYALIASGIAAVIISIILGLGNTLLNGYYTKVADGLR